jgi:hypothetical protein
MNQIQIQEKTREKRMLEKAIALVEREKATRSSCAKSRNLWMVGSYSTAKKWYVVRWNEELKCFMCACRAFEFSSNNMCLHIAAVALYEGGYGEQ